MSEQEATLVPDNKEQENSNIEEQKEPKTENAEQNEEENVEKESIDVNSEKNSKKHTESASEEKAEEKTDVNQKEPQEDNNGSEIQKEVNDGEAAVVPKEENLPENVIHGENKNTQDEIQEEKKEEAHTEDTTNIEESENKMTENGKDEPAKIVEKPKPAPFTQYLLFDLKLREYYKEEIEKCKEDHPTDIEQPVAKSENKPSGPPPEPMSFTKYIMFDQELKKYYNEEKTDDVTATSAGSLEEKKGNIAAALLGSNSDSDSNSDNEDKKDEKEEIESHKQAEEGEDAAATTRSINENENENKDNNCEENKSDENSMILTTNSIATLELSPVEEPKSPRSQYRPRPPHTPPASPRRSVRARSFSPQQEPELSEKELNRLKESALKGEPMKDLTDGQTDQLLRVLVEERNAKAAENNFKESQRYQKAVSSLTDQQMKRKKASAQKEVLDQIESELKGKRDELAAFDKETEDQIKKFKEDKDAQRRRLEETHQEQLDKHAAEWTADKKVRQYNRASHGLINLRKQFKLLVQQCRFADASDVKAIIDRTEAGEKAVAHAQMQHDFDESLRKLEAKQEGEREFLETNAVVQLAQLEQKRARLRVALVNKLRKVEAQAERAQDQDKVWNSLQMQRLEQVSNAQPRSANASATTTTKVTISTGSTREDATISLPPLNVKRAQRGQTRKSQRGTN